MGLRPLRGLFREAVDIGLELGPDRVKELTSRDVFSEPVTTGASPTCHKGCVSWTHHLDWYSKGAAVERQSLDHQDRFFAKILSEGVPGVPETIEAAYIERLEKEQESGRYTAFAATLRDGTLSLHSLLSEGYNRLDGEKRQISTAVIPLRQVRGIDIQNEVSGFGAETFRGTLHFHHPIEGWDSPLQLPLKEPGRVNEQRHGKTAKDFIFAVIDALNSTGSIGARA